MTAPVSRWDRIPAIVSFANPARHAETYGFAGTSGNVFLEGQYMIPAGRVSRTLYLFMHPASTLQLLPMPVALVEQGLHVLCAASRYPKNDSALIIENAAIDMGAWIRDARDRGYDKVVLVGWSGGGSLSLFYQSEAEDPSITATPAGDPIDFAAAGLVPADGIIFIAAHLSRAHSLTDQLDPSMSDEGDPERRDPELDIYSPDCPYQPPYPPEFVSRFRAGQLARNRRITAWCEEKLDLLKRRGGPETERSFVVHRTMCDVRWFDATIDPNGRTPGVCYLGDPRQVNVSPVGLARYTSLRSWLSQWSFDRSNANGPRNAARVRRTPVLQIENLADDAVPATHNPIMYAALQTSDKQLVQIQQANHYYRGQPKQLAQCLDAVLAWSRQHEFLSH